MKKKTINLSIVIPTLGEDSIFQCLDCIKKNTFLPEEILIVIPKNLSYKIESNTLPPLSYHINFYLRLL